MDLKKLWELVYAHGGSNQVDLVVDHSLKTCVFKVCLKKRWASIGRCFNPPASMTNLSFHIKRIFERYLLPFEQVTAFGWVFGHEDVLLVAAFSGQSNEEKHRCAAVFMFFLFFICEARGDSGSSI